MLKIGKIELPHQPLLLAPMEDVTDAGFRILCKQYGADVVYSEFISSEGYIRSSHKYEAKLSYSESERPFGIQIFGNRAEAMAIAAKQAEQTGADIIDLNFGCPVKKIVSKNCGAALLRDIPLMIQITEAVVKATNLPVTAKTRLGWDDTDKPIMEVTERLQDSGIKALTIHGRTRSQLYSGKADWSLIGEVKNNPKINIPIFGNGDIRTPEDAKNAFKTYEVDGVMIGRAAIGHPRLFKEIKHFINTGKHLPIITIDERCKIARLLLKYGIEHKGEKRGIFELRKHYGNLFKSVKNFKPYKIRLMEALTQQEIENVINDIAKFMSDDLVTSD